MIDLIKQNWKLRRDLISDGFDQALNNISKQIPLKIHKFKTGTKCWTWTIPKKWSIKKAYIQDLKGNRLLDLKDNPLHIVSYSLPINKIVSKKELLKHLHTKKELPNAIPFEFKYYEKDWGFCIQHNKLKNFTAKQYQVVIDSKFENGTLKVGDCTIKGKSNKTIVLLAHLCHPAMVNDDLTGVAVAIDIVKELLKKDNNYTYKLLLVPETIGSIAYLSQNEHLIPKIQAGIYFEMLSNNNTLALQHSWQGNEKIDKIAKYVMKKKLKNFREGDFRKIVGNDEMVFNGPGVAIPTISISRYPYPQYHTSKDNPNIVSIQRLKQAKEVFLEIIKILDSDFTPKRKFKGPIFLSGYGLWKNCSKDINLKTNTEQIMLRLEGNKTVFQISQETNIPFDNVLQFINKLEKKGLVKKEC